MPHLILGLLTTQVIVWWWMESLEEEVVSLLSTMEAVSLDRYGLLEQEVEPLQDGCLQTVTGLRAPIHRWSDVQLGVGTLELPHRVLMANIKDDCILGFDFLKRHGCVVDFQQDALTINRSPYSGQSRLHS